MTDAPPLIDAKDYLIDKQCIATGAWGTVHRAQKKDTREWVAMKFFGYTKNHPVNRLITEEVMCMLQLRGVQGVAQLIGIFVDTKEGLVPNKNKKFSKEGYPVIVMDFLEGGDLFSMVTHRIVNKLPVNEKFLAPAFRSAMESLLSIHNRGFIHRDLKLDNLVLTSKADDAAVKIIDCGYFCRALNGVVYETQLVGSPGYFAPESLEAKTGLREYSYKTDVWQAGCALYIMLSAKLPFSQKYEDFGDIITGRYYPLNSLIWQDVSSSAKSLITAMLHPNPKLRLSVEGVLSHPWLTNATQQSNAPHGQDYVMRIKGMQLRRKLKVGFLAGKVEENHKEMKENFQEELQYLHDVSQENKDKNELDMEANAILKSHEFHTNLKTLKTLIMEKIRIATDQGHLDEVEKNQVFISPPPMKRTRSSIYGEDIDFEEFKTLVAQCNLDCLATEKIFGIFDGNRDGIVNMKEFLFALIALKPFESSENDEEPSDASELYFRFFDLDEDGYVGLDELKFALNCLFQDCNLGDSISQNLDGDNAPTKIFDAEAVFKQIDKKINGRIDIFEFKQFYCEILAATVSQKHSIRPQADQIRPSRPSDTNLQD